MSVAWSAADLRFMRQALALAERGLGTTKPNPVVGAVLVKNGKVLAEGFHRRAGLPHAEIEALAKVGGRARGATLYVTLEPCCHQGRTGPCTEAIIAAGLSRVVVGCCDENPQVSGRGIARLRQSGLRVDAGCLKEECHRINRNFFRWIRARRPWVTMKVAATLDGFIGDRLERRRKGQSRWITGLPARAVAHELRSEHDAVLIGLGTVVADNPRLTVRLAKGRPRPLRKPLRVVLDSLLRTPPTARILDPNAAPILIVGADTGTPDRGFAYRRQLLESSGAEVALVATDGEGRVSLPALLRLLADREVQSLLVEGGSRIHGAFVREGLVDAVAIFLAPRLVGAGVPVVEGTGLDWRKPAVLGPISVRQLGEDVLLVAEVVHRGERRRLSATMKPPRLIPCSPASSRE